jgi:hypothetical protein
VTLSGLIDQPLQNRFGDPSLRYAYPLATWVLEQSSTTPIPVTLQIPIT